MKAASQGHQHVIDFLLGIGADPTPVDAQGLSYHQILDLPRQNEHSDPSPPTPNETQGSRRGSQINAGVFCSQCQRQTIAVMSFKNRILCLECGKGKKNVLHQF
jgi:hypothetical protein